MFIRLLRLGFIGMVLLAASAWAAPSVLQGVVKDPNGRPVKGADIRIEAKDGSKLFKTVKTDVNGRYVSDALPAGAYRVTLILNGAVKASIDGAKTKSGQPTQLNFDLKSAAASQASGSVKKTKHKVWVTAGTGTHLGGRWVEEDDNSTALTSTDKVDKVDPFALKKLQGTHGTVTPP
jgi:Carboxypeptidase regulatory-like domain